MLDAARERAIGLGYSAGWGVVKAVPRRMSARAFRAAADAATVRNGPGVRQLRKNLRRVVGPGMSELRMDALVGAALRSYSRYWLETFRLETMDHDAIAADSEPNMAGVEHLDAGLARGKGVVVALPHTGNWDAAAIWLVRHSGAFTTVAERLKPESLFDRFVAYRESLGMEVIALTGGTRPPIQVLADRLAENRVICLLADRDLSRNGVPVEFFGEATKMPSGPAVLAGMTGATLLTARPRFVGDGWGVTFSGPIDVPPGTARDQVAVTTQAIADRLAEGIAQEPADWHMLQRLWLADLPPRPAPVEPARG
jgi:phosphatidylinositol dimannoside acyltransferase